MIFSLEWQLLALCEQEEFTGILWGKHSGLLSTTEKTVETLLVEGKEHSREKGKGGVCCTRPEPLVIL